MDARSWQEAGWAYDRGLYNRILEAPDLLDEAVYDLASFLAGSSPQAMRALKKALWEDTGYWEAELEERAAVSGELVCSDYTRAFIKDFKKR
jgi:methylglutaconyl-CoA hydratase